MPQAAVTFDFHNTIARCDGWFELEIRQLAAAYLQWETTATGQPPLTDVELAAARDAYRQLRLEIIEHGDELTADACVIEALHRMGRPANPALVARGVAELMRRELPAATPMPGVVDTLRALHAASVPIGIISSAVYHPFLEWTLAKFDLRDSILVITTTASAHLYKSRPALFWQAAAALGAAPEQTIHVGDSYRFDVEGAGRAGMRSVWVQLDGAVAPESEFIPALTVSTLEGTASAIQQLARAGRG